MSASSSNRNFSGRKGSPTGRTLLMSAAEVRFGDRGIKAAVPDGLRNQLVAGTWELLYVKGNCAVAGHAHPGPDPAGSYFFRGSCAGSTNFVPEARCR